MVATPSLARAAPPQGAGEGHGAGTGQVPPASAVEFRWDAPTFGCPAEQEVRAELEALVGRPLEEVNAGRLTVIARVRQEPDGTWDLRLWTVTPEQTRYRTLQDRSCALVSSAGALIAAMVIDPGALDAGVGGAVREAARAAEAGALDVGPEGGPPPEEMPTSPDASGPATEGQPDGEEEEKGEDAPDDELDGHADPDELTALGPTDLLPDANPSALRLGVGMGAGAALDGRPGVGADVALALALGSGAALGELGLHFGPGVVSRLPQVSRDAAFEVLDLHLSARGCWDWRRHPRLAFGACGGAELGALLGRGLALSVDDIDAVPWVALTARASGSVRLGSALWLELSPDLVVPLTRTRFEVEGLGVVHTPRNVGGRIFLGLRWWWGPGAFGGRAAARSPGRHG